MQACKLELPSPNQTHHHLPSLVVTSIFIEPLSRSLALMLSDTSLLLYPPNQISISLPLPSSPSSPTLVPPPCSSACFLRLHHRRGKQQLQLENDGRVLFLSAMPDKGGIGTLLRAWILDDHNQVFNHAPLNFKRHANNRCSSSMAPAPPYDDGKLLRGGAAVLDLPHGFTVKLAGGSVNVFALHSPSASKIWILAGKLAVDDDADPPVSEKEEPRRMRRRHVIDLLKCSVIDCTLPIFSIRVTLGHLFLGEEKGVRVFPLRPLVKGRRRRIICDKLSSVNGREEVCSNFQSQMQGAAAAAAAAAAPARKQHRRSRPSSADKMQGNNSDSRNSTREGVDRSSTVQRTAAADAIGHHPTNEYTDFQDKNPNGGSSTAVVLKPDSSLMGFPSGLEIQGAMDFDSLVINDLLKNGDKDTSLCPPRGEKTKSRNGMINENNDDLYACNALYSKSVFTWRNDNNVKELFHNSSLSDTNPTHSDPQKKKKSTESKEIQSGEPFCSADYRRKSEADCIYAKIWSVKLRQDSGDLGSFFVPFRCREFHDSRFKAPSSLSQRAVSIHPLSQEKFLVLDSNGDLHFLNLHRTVGSEVNDDRASEDGSMRLLDCTMKVQMLAVHPGISTRSQSVWVSDGSHSVHVMLVLDVDIPLNEIDKDTSQEKVLQFSATQAIFTSERIQDIGLFAPNAALILGQGNIFAYSVA